MVAQTQADSAAVLGLFSARALSQLTESLKAEFSCILSNTLLTVESLSNEASVQLAADLCAEKCREKLANQISGSNDLLQYAASKTATEQASQLPSLSLEKTSKALASECSSCTFFDLTSDDSPDDVSTSANSSGSASDTDFSEDSIEFLYEESLQTINVNKIPDDFVALHEDIRGLQDIRDYTAKDLQSLYDDIRCLRKELQELRDVREESSSISSTSYPETFRVRRHSQVAPKKEPNQWVAAKSPGVCGDIGDHMRSKLRQRQERPRSATFGRPLPWSGKSEVQVYLSNVKKMSR